MKRPKLPSAPPPPIPIPSVSLYWRYMFIPVHPYVEISPSTRVFVDVPSCESSSSPSGSSFGTVTRSPSILNRKHSPVP